MTNEQIAAEAARLEAAGRKFLAEIDADLCGLNATYAPLGTPILVFSPDDRCWVAAEAAKDYYGNVRFWPIPPSRESDEIYGVVAYLPMLPKPLNAKS